MPRALAMFATVLLAGCSQAIPRKPVAGASFDLDPIDLRERGAPSALVARLHRDAFAYFRMLAEPFELRVCDAFASLSPGLPLTAVEGDAHMQQFAVTRGSYGLDDFDRGGFGPSAVDLVRYAASIHLVCRQVKFPCDSNASVARLLTAYRAALIAPPDAPAVPRVVGRMRARAVTSNVGWLDTLQRMWGRIDATREREVRSVWRAYVREHDPDASPETTAIVAIGTLNTGVGSATARRAVLRIAGATDSPGDDVIVEVRRGITSTARSCVWRGPPNEAIALLAMSIIRRDMPAMHGFVLGPSPAWLQSWDPSYVELALRDLASQTDVDELVTDAAIQLARHTWSWYPERMRTDQRDSQVAAFERTRMHIMALARQLADETVAAWTRFVRL